MSAATACVSSHQRPHKRNARQGGWERFAGDEANLVAFLNAKRKRR
jgi:hypothetical protein